jgi:hypothetical protein
MHGGVIAPATACGCGEETTVASQCNGERMWQISCGIVELMKRIPISFDLMATEDLGMAHGCC